MRGDKPKRNLVKIWGRSFLSFVIFALLLWLILALMLSFLPVFYIQTAAVHGVPSDPAVRDVVVWFCLCLLETGWAFAGSLCVVKVLFGRLFGKKETI